jgi:hypothetical protein
MASVGEYARAALSAAQMRSTGLMLRVLWKVLQSDQQVPSVMPPA